MRYALSRQSKEALSRLTASAALMAFDFDGTLAPIVDDPDSARMRPTTRRLFRRVASAYPCVVISGRSRTDLRSKLAGTGIQRVIGNHGAEPWQGAETVRESIAQWHSALAAEVPHHAGLRIEDKTLSLTVHYRQCRSKAKIRAQIVEAALRLPGARLIPGKQAISIVPENAPNKGAALREEMERLGCGQALYIGDDVTDEDAFAVDEGLRVLTIRVGRSLASRAAYFIRSQAEIDGLLNALLST